MSATAGAPPPNYDAIEQLAHIRQLLIDGDRKSQEMRFEPWKIVISSMTAGAALFAAAVAVAKLLLP